MTTSYMTTSLEQLLYHHIQDLFDAEIQYEKLLPRMFEHSTHVELKNFMNRTDEETSENITQLRQVCNLLQISPHGVECEAMKGLIRETRSSTTETNDSATMDAAIIANAQRIAHYEIAGFGTASAFAKCINQPEASSILSKLTESAGARDKDLTKIATGGWFTPGINAEAAIA